MLPVDCPSESTPQAEEVRARRPASCTSSESAWRQVGTVQSMSEARNARVGELAAQQRTRLMVVAKRLCRGTTDAEDLVHETLYRFIRDFGQVEVLPSERACESWMVTTLTNLFYDQCRRQRVQENRAKELVQGNEAVAPPEPVSQPVYDAITHEQFNQAVQALSPKARAAFELHATGKRYLDIARLLGITPGTARKRLHDARAKLRELLQPYLPPGGH
jgi:RNA polymerase sigma factor (sigma-70 family)